LPEILVKRLTTAIRPSRRASISLMGLLGTLLLHGLLVLPFVLDLSLPAPRLPNRSGAGASAVASNREPVMTAIFINEPCPVDRLTAIKPVELASRGVAPMDLPVIVFSPDSAPASDADPNSADKSVSVEAAGDQTQHALLYRRYLGQIQARIDRAWVRPRTEIAALRFSCGVRIEQDRQGGVVKIGLEHCTGSPRWQQSLVSAIRTASPLPAPPDPSVYADVLSLVFESDGFRPDGSSDGFEPANASALVANQERESFAHFAERAGTDAQRTDKNGTDIIHLTIIGNPHAGPMRITPEPRSHSPEADAAASQN
jgi:TonB-like protein